MYGMTHQTRERCKLYFTIIDKNVYTTPFDVYKLPPFYISNIDKRLTWIMNKPNYICLDRELTL